MPELHASQTHLTDIVQCTEIRVRSELGQYEEVNARRKAAEAAVYDAKLSLQYCYIRASLIHMWLI